MKKTVPISISLTLLAASLAATEGALGDGSAVTVTEGTKVDRGTYIGFTTWKAAGCGRCHGANQEGIVGPSLIERLKMLSKTDFVTTVTEGRGIKGMPSFASNNAVITNIDNLYAYLKARSDGRIAATVVEETAP